MSFAELFLKLGTWLMNAAGWMFFIPVSHPSGIGPRNIRILGWGTGAPALSGGFAKYFFYVRTDASSDDAFIYMAECATAWTTYRALTLSGL